jgi:hypothetical protein
MVETFINYEAIRLLALDRVKVDGIVIWASKISDQLPLDLLDNLLTLWCNTQFVEQGKFEYMERVAIGIVACLRVIGKDIPRKHVEKYLNSVPKYLESVREKVRVMGMVVSQLCSKRMTPLQSLKLLDTIPVDFQYLCDLLDHPLRVKVDSTHSTQATNSTLVSKGNDTITKNTPSIPYFQNISTKRPDRILFQPRNIKDETPKYLKQCLDLLKKHEPNAVELALKNLVTVIQKSSITEVSEIAEELVEVLVYIQDEYEIEEFDVYVCNALISLALHDDSVGYLLPFHFTQKQITIASQMRILRLLVCIPMLFVNVLIINVEG